MLQSSTPVTPGILDGRIEQLRVSVPTPMGDIYLRVDGVPVIGTIEDAAMVRTVRGLREQAAPVRIGVLTDAAGTHYFSWLIARKGPGVPPRFYVDERRNGWRGVGIGLVIAAACIAAAWMLGIGSAWRAITLAVLLAFAFAGVVFAGVSLHALWFNRLHRAAILQSEAAFREYSGKPPAVTPVRTPAPVLDTAPPPVATDTQDPPMQRIHGALKDLTHESVRSANSGPSYGLYRFVVGQQPYLMRVGENLGDIKPFLAEGDMVDMAVHAADRPGAGPHRLVYAMRNLEDGRVYVCHHGFRGGDRRISPVGVGLTQRAPMLRLVAGLFLFTWLLLAGLGWFSGLPGDRDDLPALLTYAFIGFAVLWFCVALPFVYLDMRWKQGRPTRRQRILERVYLTLRLGTPFAPTARIEEV